MTKTNKEVRSNFAEQMWDKKKERDEQFQMIDTLPISEDLKEQKRKEIMDNFEDEIKKIKNNPEYEDARKIHSVELQHNAWFLELTKNIRNILQNIRKKYVKVEENEKWVKWKIFHIELPGIYNRYWWFRFEWFIPDEKINIKDFGNKVNKEKLYTYGEIEELYKNIRDYMKAAYIDKYWFEEYSRNSIFWWWKLKTFSRIWPFNEWIYWLKDKSHSAYLSEWEQKQALWIPNQYPDLVYAWRKTPIYKDWKWEHWKTFLTWHPIYKLH